jgi:6-pyruvoyltetrahydropterin/6-carboxytetrahydropterin synthase
MFEVRVRGSFVALHRLRLPDGTLEPSHGHDWHVWVTYAGPRLDAHGLLADFTPIRAALERITTALHGQDLNVLPAFANRNPSAEHVALHVAGALPAALPNDVRLTLVEVEEEPGCFAGYRPPG